MGDAIPVAPTCGYGRAAAAVVPTTLGELTAALVEVLAIHTQALTATDAATP